MKNLPHVNKTEFVALLAEKSGMSQQQAHKALEDFMSTLTDCFQKQQKVQLTGFGHFNFVQIAAHTGRNPQTGKPLAIAASNHITFTAGTVLKRAINPHKA
jgi:nucleoid DNA-binding protein